MFGKASGLTSFDHKILWSAVVTLLGASYLFYDDSLLTSWSRERGPTIAVLQSTQNDVRQKSRKEVRWSPVRSEQSSVHLGDSVFTGDNSTAVVRLKDGSQLELSANSLVVFDQAGKQLNLSMEFGKLRGQVRGEINIDGNVIRGDNATIELESQGKGNLRITPIQGRVTTSQGELKGTSQLGRNKAPTTARTAPVWLAPQSGQKILVRTRLDGTPVDPNRVELRWRHPGRSANFEMQLAQDADFTRGLTTERLNKKRTASPPLTSGRYFARVREIPSLNPTGSSSQSAGPSAWSETLGFEIEMREQERPLLAAPTLLGPIDMDRYRPETLVINWSNVKGAQSYELQLAKDKTFALPESLRVTKNQGPTPTLELGEHWARVRAWENDQRSGNWSDPVQVKVVDTTSRQLALGWRPRLQRSQYEIDLRQESALSLRWTTHPSAKTYRLELGRDASFTEVIQRLEAEAGLLRWVPEQRGSFFLRIVADRGSDLPAATSDPVPVNVSSTAPKIERVPEQSYLPKNDKDSGAPTEFEVQWNPHRSAARFELEVAKTPNFERPVRISTERNQTRIKVERPGIYYTRVRALGREGQSLSEFSPPAALSYLRKSPLAKPELQSPLADLTLFFPDLTKPAFFLEWASVPSANLYTFEIAKDSNFQEILLRQSISQTRALIRQNLPQGPLHWRVRAEASATGESSSFMEAESNPSHRVSEWSATRGFILLGGRSSSSQAIGVRVQRNRERQPASFRPKTQSWENSGKIIPTPGEVETPSSPPAGVSP